MRTRQVFLAVQLLLTLMPLDALKHAQLLLGGVLPPLCALCTPLPRPCDPLRARAGECAGSDRDPRAAPARASILSKGA